MTFVCVPKIVCVPSAIRTQAEAAFVAICASGDTALLRKAYAFREENPSQSGTMVVEIVPSIVLSMYS